MPFFRGRGFIHLTFCSLFCSGKMCVSKYASLESPKEIGNNDLYSKVKHGQYNAHKVIYGPNIGNGGKSL
jgi:hypothetical protein